MQQDQIWWCIPPHKQAIVFVWLLLLVSSTCGGYDYYASALGLVRYRKKIRALVRMEGNAFWPKTRED